MDQVIVCYKNLKYIKKKKKIELYNQRINVKKRIKFYTSFQHFKKLTLILSENDE